MSRPPGAPKVCSRCGRAGSHAFRKTSDGLYECTTTTACRSRARRQAGARQAGRGRLPKPRGQITGPGPGVAYVVGAESPDRDLVAGTLREVTGLAVAVGAPTKQTLTSLGLRNVKLIAVSGECLQAIAFRNEFALRCRQPKLSSVPIFIYGPDRLIRVAGEHLPGAAAIGYLPPGEISSGLRRTLAVRR